jgi:Putative peptidoglycan binding domain
MKKMTTIRKYSVLAFVVLAVNIVTSCGGNSESLSDKLTFATGVWEGFTQDITIDSNKVKPFVTDDRIFAATYSSNDFPENTDCTQSENFVAGKLTIYEYSKETFREMQSIEMVDKFVNSLATGDIKNDTTIEIMLMSSCMRALSVSAFELTNSSWVPVPDVNASTYSNGMLMSIGIDCTPSCADGGVSYTKIEWNGSQFVEAGFVTSEGKPVNLEVNGTCPSYKTAVALPLAMCDQGPLVQQFVALVKNIDTFDESLSSLGDRFTPELAKWAVEYRYLHGLSVAPIADEEFFEHLGGFWYPEQLTENWNLFPEYCSRGGEYNCESYSFLFPTNECPSYRNAVYEFPVKRCDFGGWVFMIFNGLKDFDGKDAVDELGIGLFNKDIEERIRQFQKQNKLQVDGLVGPNTWKAMFGTANSETGDINGDGLYGPGDIIPH